MRQTLATVCAVIALLVSPFQAAAETPSSNLDLETIDLGHWPTPFGWLGSNTLVLGPPGGLKPGSFGARKKADQIVLWSAERHIQTVAIPVDANLDFETACAAAGSVTWASDAKSKTPRLDRLEFDAGRKKFKYVEGEPLGGLAINWRGLNLQEGGYGPGAEATMYWTSDGCNSVRWDKLVREVRRQNPFPSVVNFSLASSEKGYLLSGLSEKLYPLPDDPKFMLGTDLTTASIPKDRHETLFGPVRLNSWSFYKDGGSAKLLLEFKPGSSAFIHEAPKDYELFPVTVSPDRCVIVVRRTLNESRRLWVPAVPISRFGETYDWFAIDLCSPANKAKITAASIPQ